MRLKELGFEVLPSKANFLFARHPALKGEAYYRALKQRGVLVRHFAQPESIADLCASPSAPRSRWKSCFKRPGKFYIRRDSACAGRKLSATPTKRAFKWR